MALDYVFGARDSKMLVYKGYLYLRVRDVEGKTLWRCSEYSRIKCKGQVYLNGQTVCRYIGHVNHLPNTSKIQTTKALSIMRTIATQTTLSARDVLRYMATQVSPDILMELPSYSNLVKTVNRIRKKIRDREVATTAAAAEVATMAEVTTAVQVAATARIPSLYEERYDNDNDDNDDNDNDDNDDDDDDDDVVYIKTVLNPANSNFSITGLYWYTHGGELFLQYDTGPTSRSRMLIFATQHDLDFMAGCSHWFCDGTFSVRIPVFQQLYTVHGVHSAWKTSPAIYVLLSDTDETTYRQVFEVIKSLMTRRGRIPWLTAVTVDHQPAAYHAVRHAFPDARVACSFFHTTQRVYRIIREVGLHQKYGEDHSFSVHVKMLPALAYVPEPYVRRSYDALIATGYYADNERMLRPLLERFEATWLGRTDRAPVFPSFAWNCFATMTADAALFECTVERWHNMFTATMNGAFPSVWEFIDIIKKDENAHKNRVNAVPDTVQEARQKTCRTGAMKIYDLCTKYRPNMAANSVHDYLRQIARNFQLQA